MYPSQQPVSANAPVTPMTSPQHTPAHITVNSAPSTVRQAATTTVVVVGCMLLKAKLGA